MTKLDLDDVRSPNTARLAILEIVAGYGLLFDAGYGEHPDPDWAERFGRLWARDAQFGTYPNLVVDNKIPVRGRDNIVATFQNIMRSYPHSHFVRHLSTNTVVDELDAHAGKARARSALIAAGVHDFSKLTMHRTGVYFDWFCIEDGRWCLARRDLVYDGPKGPGAALPAGWFRNGTDKLTTSDE